MLLAPLIEDAFNQAYQTTPPDQMTDEQAFTIFKSVLDQNAFLVTTVGPTAPPGTLIPLDFINYIIDLRSQAQTQLWITQPSIIPTLDDKLNAIKTSIIANNNAAAITNINDFINEVENQKDTALTSEAYALLKFNAIHLRDRLIDLLPPITVLQITPDENPSGWHTADVSIHLTAADNSGGSGVRHIGYRFNEDASILVSGSVVDLPFSQEGTTSFHFHAMDQVGNMEADQPVTIKIDKSSPSVSASVSPEPDVTGWNTSNVTVSITGADTPGGSGVTEIHYTIDGSGEVIVVGTTATIPLTTDGMFTINYYAVDAAGNSGSGGVLHLKINKTLLSSPSALTAVDTPWDNGGAIDLTWVPSSSPNVTEQRLYRSTTSGGPYTRIYTFTEDVSDSFTDTNSGAGLTNGITYYYVIRAFNGTSESTEIREASAVPLNNPIMVTTGAASAIIQTAARLNGVINPNGQETTIWFEWGTTTAYGNSTPSQLSGSGIADLQVNHYLTGLSPLTPYHYRAVGLTGGVTTYGADATFTTLANPPTAVTGGATNISQTAGTINGTANPNGISGTSWFEWGPFITGNTTASQPINGATDNPISMNLTGLTPNHEYFYRIVAQTSSGTTFGAVASFYTLPDPPVSVTGSASNISATSVTLSGTANSNGDLGTIWFEYGLTTGYGSISSTQTTTGYISSNISIQVTGLNPGTVYHYRMAVQNRAGTTYGTDATFTTVGQDLVMMAVSGPASGVVGAALSITDTTKNQGAIDATNAFNVCFYLSVDNVITAADIPLGSRTITSLALGASNSATTSVTIPAGIAERAYYIGAIADCNNTAAESNESNNALAASSTVAVTGADLRTGLLPSLSGSNILIDDAVTNYGNAAAGAFTIQYYLSTNTVYDAGDTQLSCSRSVTSLAGGGASNPASGTVRTTCPIPAVTPGFYYVISYVDRADTVKETNENNNIGVPSFPLGIGPDLAPETITASISGTNLLVNDSVINQGSLAAGAFTIRFYLSTDTNYDASDIQLNCSRSVASLASNTFNPATGTTQTTCPMPSVPPGLYYVIVYDDGATSALAEIFETNNTAATSSALNIGADLTPTAFTASISGTNILVNDSVKNIGGTAAGAFTVRFFLSTNNVYDAGDTQLSCSRAIASLAANTSNPASGTTQTTCAIPSIAPGLYYVIAYDDGPTSAIAESVETNNILATTSPLNLGADLIPTALTASISGTNILVNDSVKNQGGTAAGAFTVRFFLSVDNVYDAGDIQLSCSRSITSLAANTSNPTTGTTQTTCAIPSIPLGPYYVIVYDDGPTSAIAESAETNNTLATVSPINIGADLIPTALTASISGTNILVNDSVKNQGGSAAGAFTIRFFLSADNIYGTGDVQMSCSRAITSLAANTSNPASGTTQTTCAIPSIAPGLYYVIAYDDGPTSAIAESVETNNTRATTTALNIGPDLTPTALTASISGANILVNDSVKNQGSAAAGAFTIRFYLSTDNAYDAADIQMSCSRSITSLAANTSNPTSGTTQTTCAIPSVPPGPYFVIAYDDGPTSAISESVETNNVRATTAALNIGSDLNPTALTATKSGSTLTLKDSVKNQGTAAAGAFTISFYLSLDNTYQAGTDIFICSRSVTSLAAGASNPTSGTQTTTCTVPSAPAGSYFVIVNDDSGNTISESLENNNTRATTATIAIP